MFRSLRQTLNPPMIAIRLRKMERSPMNKNRNKILFGIFIACFVLSFLLLEASNYPDIIWLIVGLFGITLAAVIFYTVFFLGRTFLRNHSSKNEQYYNGIALTISTAIVLCVFIPFVSAFVYLADHFFYSYTSKTHLSDLGARGLAMATGAFLIGLVKIITPDIKNGIKAKSVIFPIPEIKHKIATVLINSVVFVLAAPLLLWLF